VLADGDVDLVNVPATLKLTLACACGSRLPDPLMLAVTVRRATVYRLSWLPVPLLGTKTSR